MSAFASDLLGFVEERLSRIERSVAPGFVLPAVFAGHLVGPDTRADLAYTLAFLHQAGGHEHEPAIRAVLAAVDGPATHTFYSYRVAETVLALGGLAAFAESDHANLLAAADSTATIPVFEAGGTPPNYAAVLARCEHDRQLLGAAIDDAVLERLVTRLRTMFCAHRSGFVDESHDGAGRFDIYTPDIYLFAEPLADRLGPALWRDGLGQVIAAVEPLVADNGAAVTWGRSIGALSVCMTIELAATAIAHGLVDTAGAGRWLGLAANALDRLDGWFSPDGVITAHQHRSTERYRGPHRRLQMTFDCLGKLAAAGLTLRDRHLPPVVDGRRDHDGFTSFSDGGAGVWAHRSRGLRFVLPVVDGAHTDYLATPRQPGTFESPVERPLFSYTPVAWVDGRAHVTAGLAPALHHRRGALTATFATWKPADPTQADLTGVRRVTYTVAGRTLLVDEQLNFAAAPDAVTLQVPEASGRPLRVEVTAARSRATRIDTAGLAEWRSPWGELPVVHQFELDPAPEIRFRWAVTPKLRVATNIRHHHYHRSLYDPLADRVHETSFPNHLVRPGALDIGRMAAALADVDIVHVHWPEYFAGPDVATNEAIVTAIRRAGARIVWTQHNRVPHAVSGCEPVYALWAAAADGVIHHSHWGRDLMAAIHHFRADAVHAVIPHGHWSTVMGGFDELDRAEVEAQLGLPPTTLRLGVIGAPRPGKDVQLVIDAVHASQRDDIQLYVTSLSGAETVPDDPRIVALPYAFEDRSLYNRRLKAIDVLVLPFAPEQMLTTGTVGDAVAAGIPALVSSWPYLHEALGAAGMAYGDSAAGLTALIDGLDGERVAAAGAAARALRAPYDWGRLAEATHDLLEAVGTAKP